MAEAGKPIYFDNLASLEVEWRKLEPYDQPIGLKLLFEDPRTGVEHDLVRYPAGMKARWHRHTAGHAILLLEGHMHVNDRTLGPGDYCYLPPGEPMWHEQVEGESCLFVIMFDGPFDVAVVDGPAGGVGRSQ